MQLMNRKTINLAFLVLAVFTAIIIGNYFLIQLPQQQEVSLRKQIYELCVKEFDETYNAAGKFYTEPLAKQVVAKVITEQEGKQKLAAALLPILSRKNEIISNCVEKRLLEYKK